MARRSRPAVSDQDIDFDPLVEYERIMAAAKAEQQVKTDELDQLKEARREAFQPLLLAVSQVIRVCKPKAAKTLFLMPEVHADYLGWPKIVFPLPGNRAWVQLTGLKPTTYVVATESGTTYPIHANWRDAFLKVMQIVARNCESPGEPAPATGGYDPLNPPSTYRSSSAGVDPGSPEGDKSVWSVVYVGTDYAMHCAGSGDSQDEAIAEARASFERGDFDINDQNAYLLKGYLQQDICIEDLQAEADHGRPHGETDDG